MKCARCEQENPQAKFCLAAGSRRHHRALAAATDGSGWSS